MNEIIQQIKAHARQAQIQPQFAKDQAWEIEQLAEALQARANERIEALQADKAKLREEIARLRGPVTYYKKGYGPGDGYAAIQERSDD